MFFCSSGGVITLWHAVTGLADAILTFRPIFARGPVCGTGGKGVFQRNEQTLFELCTSYNYRRERIYPAHSNFARAKTQRHVV